MSLRESLERIADGTPHEREAAAALLRNELLAMSRTVAFGHSDLEDVVQEFAAYVVHQCLGGVLSTWPATDQSLRNYMYTSVQRRLSYLRRRAAREVALETSVHGEQRETERSELTDEARRKAERQEQMSQAAAYLDHALVLVRPLIHALIESRTPLFREDAVATWNAMVEVYAGTELDELISHAGRTPDKAERERWHTRFKNLRHSLLEHLAQSALSPDDREVITHFIQQCLTHRGQLSVLRALRIISRRDDKS